MGPLPGILLIGCGIFSICGGLFDWEFFMNSRKAKPIIALFTRNGARAFYVVLGGVIAVLGVLMALGVMENS